MKFSQTSLGGSVEILASKDFQAIPMDFTAMAETASLDVVPAGYPAEDASGVLGICLYDVDVEANPNGALVVHGIIDAKKAEAHITAVTGSSYTYSDAIKEARPNIVFRDNIGVTADDTEDDTNEGGGNT